MEVPNLTMDVLWRVALGAVPLVALVWAVCRALPLRSSTRHALWVVVLGVLLVAPLVPAVALRGWVMNMLAVARQPEREAPAERRAIEAPVAASATAPAI